MPHTDSGSLVKPIPESNFDRERWEHTALRRRMLMGRHEQDVAREIELQIGAKRQRTWGLPDLSSNVFKSVTTQLAVLYNAPPTTSHEDAEAAEGLVGKGGILEQAGLWPLMQRFSANVLGLREMLMHISADEDSNVVYRPVTPDFVLADASPSTPDVPHTIHELRLRKHSERGVMWAWDVLSIEDPNNPTFKVISATATREDLTALFLKESRSGENYPYFDSEGEPFLPYVLYHAMKTGMLWDPWEGIEIVRGSLTGAVYQTFKGHALRTASWPQRYAVGAQVQALNVRDDDSGRRATVITDPSSLLMMESIGDQQAMIGQWGAGADVASIDTVAAAYEARIAGFASMTASDIQRVSSARSGFAISVSNAGKREAQRKQEPQARVGDLMLIETTAKILNSETGSSFPESGYSIGYTSIPLSGDERKAVREDVVAKIELGVMTRTEALMVFEPGLTEEESRKRIDAIAALPAIDVDAKPADEATDVDVSVDDVATDVAEDIAPADTDVVVVDADGEEAKAQDTALNGAQVTSAQEIVLNVSNRLLPRETGINMLIEFFNLGRPEAERVMGEVGRTFFAPAPESEDGNPTHNSSHEDDEEEGT